MSVRRIAALQAGLLLVAVFANAASREKHDADHGSGF